MSIFTFSFFLPIQGRLAVCFAYVFGKLFLELEEKEKRFFKLFAANLFTTLSTLELKTDAVD